MRVALLASLTELCVVVGSWSETPQLLLLVIVLLVIFY